MGHKLEKQVKKSLFADDEALLQNAKTRDFQEDTCSDKRSNIYQFADTVGKIIHSTDKGTNIAVAKRKIRELYIKYVLSGDMSEEYFRDIMIVIARTGMQLTDWNVSVINMRVNNGEFADVIAETRKQEYKELDIGEMDWWFDE